MVTGPCRAPLFQANRLFVHYFQPSFQLRSKTRAGAKVKQVYHSPTTPCDRLLEHGAVASAAQEHLRAERSRLDPLELLQPIREGQAARAALACAELGSGPERATLEALRAKLPELWRDGEARPTHRRGDTRPRWWRTRKDPFEGLWAEILLWLLNDPAATAQSLLERRQRAYPDRLPDGQLRTLPRRIREWRRVLARALVFACLGAEPASEKPKVVGSADQDGCSARP
jgi:hypothetical protein